MHFCFTMFTNSFGSCYYLILTIPSSVFFWLWSDMNDSWVLLWLLILVSTVYSLSIVTLKIFRSKRLWLDGFQKLGSVLTLKELSDLQEVMRDKELNIRTDIYEILLEDETDT